MLLKSPSKIERLEKRQGVMKRANHLIRKTDREGLADLGFSKGNIRRQSWLSQLRRDEAVHAMEATRLP
jgi:hypothetical protein